MTNLLNRLPYFITIFFLCSCSSQNEHETYRTSPNMKYKVQILVSDRGALGSPSTKIFFHNVGKNKKKIFEGDGGWPIEANWIGNNEVVITFCNPDNYNVINNIQTDENTADEGIKISVITSQYIMYKQMHFCK